MTCISTGATLAHDTAWSDFCLGCGYIKLVCHMMHDARDILPFVLPQLNIGPPHSPILLAAPLRPPHLTLTFIQRRCVAGVRLP